MVQGSASSCLIPSETRRSRGLHFEHDGFYLIADLNHLGRMLHAAAPGHFRDVDQPLDARLQLDESSVVGDADDAADHARAADG